jgi:plasmid stability protein
VGVSAIVHLPDELADRLAVEAARRGISVDELSAELVAAGLPPDGRAEGEPDPLEAFIGSGHSGRGDLGRRHREIKTEVTDGLAAREL